MRRVLIGLLFIAAAGILGGAVWIAVLMIRGGTSTADMIEAFRWQWAVLVGCAAVIVVVAVILQRTRPPAEQRDWTLTASLGAGACLYALVVRPWFPRSWLDGLPDSVAVLVALALSVGVAYAALRPVMKRRPAESGATGDRPRAESWFAKYDVIPGDLKVALEHTQSVPVDIDPVSSFPDVVK